MRPLCSYIQRLPPTPFAVSVTAPVYAQALQAGDAGCSERLDSLGAMGSGLCLAPLWLGPPRANPRLPTSDPHLNATVLSLLA